MRTPFFIACLLAGMIAIPATGQAPPGDGAKFKITPPEDRGYLHYPLRIMNRSTHDAYQFNPAVGEVATLSYSVSKSGWVRVRLVGRDERQMVLRTLQDWTLSDFGGSYPIAWDGNDASGNPVDRRRMFVSFQAKDAAHDGIHLGHRSESCRDPALSIIRADDKRIVAVLQGRLPGSDGAGAQRGRLYVDYQLIDEIEFDGEASDFGFAFDRASLAPGEHIVTINLDDYQDHIATASVRIRVDAPASRIRPPSRQAAPEISATDLAGRHRNLAEYRGQVVLLNFWASWCPPCRAEMPALESIYRALKDRGFVVVGVSSDVLGERAVRPVAEQMGLSFPILLDADSMITNRYGVRVRPTSYLIDRDGNLVSRMVGPQPWTSAELAVPIGELLLASPSPIPGASAPEESMK